MKIRIWYMENGEVTKVKKGKKIIPFEILTDEEKWKVIQALENGKLEIKF